MESSDAAEREILLTEIYIMNKIDNRIHPTVPLIGGIFPPLLGKPDIELFQHMHTDHFELLECTWGRV
jgi:hypothetical protein